MKKLRDLAEPAGCPTERDSETRELCGEASLIAR